MHDNKVESETPVTFPYPVTKGNVTVKIFRVKSAKNKGGCYYQVADYSQGPRRLISKADFKEALAEAERCAKLQKSGDAYALGMLGPERADYGQAVKLLEPTGTSLIQAVARYAEAVKIVGRADRLIDAAKFFALRHPLSMPSITVPDLVEEMITVKTSGGSSERYLQDLRSRLGRFASNFKGNVADVDKGQIQNWLNKLRLSPQSYVNYRTVIGGLFSFAESLGYIVTGASPVDGVQRPKVRGGDVAIFTPAEFSSLLNAAKPEFLPALAISGFAGLRSAEVQRLEWSDIDLQRRIITVSAAKAKTASRRTVPICDSLAAWLAPLAGDGFVWRLKKKKVDGDGFSRVQRRTGKDAGVKWKSNALRHSYASYRLSEIGDAPRTAMELGNSPAVVHRHYKELVRPEDAKAWFSIMPAQKGGS